MQSRWGTGFLAKLNNNVHSVYTRLAGSSMTSVERTHRHDTRIVKITYRGEKKEITKLCPKMHKCIIYQEEAADTTV